MADIEERTIVTAAIVNDFGTLVLSGGLASLQDCFKCFGANVSVGVGSVCVTESTTGKYITTW